jgi:hypothetical protein
MKRYLQIGLLALAAACGILVGRISESQHGLVYAQEATADPGPLIQGRFHVAPVYAAEKRETAMIDSQTGRTYILVPPKDKNGNPIQAFREIPFSSCTDSSCLDFQPSLLPRDFDRGRIAPERH